MLPTGPMIPSIGPPMLPIGSIILPTGPTMIPIGPMWFRRLWSSLRQYWNSQINSVLSSTTPRGVMLTGGTEGSALSS